MIHMIVRTNILCHYYVFFYHWFDALIMDVFAKDSYISSRKKIASKVPTTKSFGSGSRQEEEPGTPWDVYDDNTRLLEKGETPLKWGEVFHMFKKKNFPMEAKD